MMRYHGPLDYAEHLAHEGCQFAKPKRVKGAAKPALTKRKQRTKAKKK